ncbi:MAG TPA: methyltransferase domain-containing protein [Steroidobacteraceae bacterium]
MTRPQPITNSLPGEEWAGAMGERWLAHLRQFEGMISPVGQVLLQRAAFRPGERVIDIGCGAGATSIDIAQQVAPHGAVLGVDISPRLIEAAEERGRAENVTNVTFRCADATTVSLEGARFDRLFSRFGLMFFTDARAAFANLRTLLREGGRADFSVWAPARENPWVTQVMGIIGQYVDLPAPVPRSPGPFALDDPDYVRELLAYAGFKPPRIDSWQGEQPVGGPGASPEEAVAFVLDAMSFGEVLKESAPDILANVKTELTQLFARNRSDAGILLWGKAHLVSAIA